ncbi:MAG: hypothetical protein V3R99_00750 [Thermoguttaceae bacterium]
MLRSFKCSWLIWLGVGLVGGLMMGGLWPDTPLHAVATDRSGDQYIMTTAPIDEETEGIYVLDCLTGELGMSLMNPMVGKFYGNQVGAFATPLAVRPILTDFGIDPSKNPRFMMVSGLTRTQRSSGSLQLSRSMVYVMEVTTGKVIAYVFQYQGSLARLAGGTINPIHGIILRAPATGGPPIGAGGEPIPGR